MIAQAALKPMLATLIDAPFDDPGWLFETKWDGFRLVATVAGGKVALYSRNGNDVTADYPAVAAALARAKHDLVLDGELVALDEAGLARFQLLQRAKRQQARLRYCVFDLLFVDGEDLRELPLVARKRRLKAVLPKASALSFSAHVVGDGVAAFKAAQRAHLEGIIGKRAQSPYRSGRRSPDWVKIKTGLRQEVVIVGFTAPKRSRQYFGALVLAVRDGRAWRYVGRVGTGFDGAALAALHARLKPLIQQKSPVTATVPDARATTWVRPALVCEVKFSEWTGDGQMRHPVFMGLRDDKRATAVVREAAVAVVRLPAPRRRVRPSTGGPSKQR